MQKQTLVMGGVAAENAPSVAPPVSATGQTLLTTSPRPPRSYATARRNWGSMRILYGAGASSKFVAISLLSAAPWVV